MLTRKMIFSGLCRWWRQLIGNGDRKQAKTACFVYYQHFSALLYREARTLLQQGFQVDVVILRRSREDKRFQRFGGLNIFAVQTRLSAERTALLYFLRLFLFYVKASLLLAFLAPERRYSLVHVTAPPDVMVFSALVPKLFGARIILDIHDIGPELFMRKMNVGEDRPGNTAHQVAGTSLRRFCRPCHYRYRFLEGQACLPLGTTRPK